MGWNLEGMRVESLYLDMPVSGVVTHSRVAYGGSVKHHMVLDSAYENGRVKRPAGDTVIVRHDSITRVSDVTDAA